jgi:hypothetical protein
MKLYLFIFLILASCANNQHSVYVAKNARYKYGEHDIKEWNNFFIGGYFQDSTTDAYQLCNARGFTSVEAVITEQRWFQNLIGGLAFGLYTPRMTYIWCK